VVLGVVIASTQPTSEPPKAAKTLQQPLQEDIAVAAENSYQTLDSQPEKRASKRVKLDLPETGTSSAPEQTTQQDLFNAEHDWRDFTVKRGDSLSRVFDKAGISPDQLVELMQLGKEARELTRIHPGDLIQVETSDAGQLQALNYQLDNFRYLRIVREQGELQARVLKYNIETRTAYASGEIDSSLFLASQAAGLSENLTMELANIFGWDIDFVLDIRQGDRFTVIYQEIFKDGEKLQDGNIIAAEFVNQGVSHRALRYVDPTSGQAGYYSPEGQSLRKAFLRSPVKFSHISSKFTRSRYHPLLHKFRSHKGVDYAAARGTPVRASGDGKVVFRGRKGGYGNVIILKHGSRYSTLYGHLSRFNSKARFGSRVKQGQVIGYVGATGLATGPHLHYEFRVNGVHRNPLTVKFPSTSPIPERLRDNFELTTQAYVAQLDVLSRNALALNKN